MAARKKSGRLYIRMDADVHKRVVKTAKALGMDMNGLLNLILRTNLLWYEWMADYASDAKTAKLLHRWRELCPAGEAERFSRDFYTLKKGHSCRLNQKWYRLIETADGYDLAETEAPTISQQEDASEGGNQ